MIPDHPAPQNFFCPLHSSVLLVWMCFIDATVMIVHPSEGERWSQVLNDYVGYEPSSWTAWHNNLKCEELTSVSGWYLMLLYLCLWHAQPQGDDVSY